MIKNSDKKMIDFKNPIYHGWILAAERYEIEYYSGAQYPDIFDDSILNEIASQNIDEIDDDDYEDIETQSSESEFDDEY